MLKLFILALAVTVGICYNREQVLSDDFMDGSHRSVMLGVPRKNNLLIRPIKMPKFNRYSSPLKSVEETTPVEQLKERDDSIEEQGFMYRRELRRHPQIRRMPEVRTLENGDQILPVEADPKMIDDIMHDMNSATETAEEEQKVVGDLTIGGKGKKGLVEIAATPAPPQFESHFEKSNYDVVAPSGKYEKPFVVAVLRHLSPIGQGAPQFSVDLDRMSWIRLGKIESKEDGDHVESSISVELKEGTDLSLANTDNGLYGFSVKSSQGARMDITNIRLEVMDFGPAPARVSGVRTVSSETVEGSGVDVLVELEPKLIATTLEHHNKTANDHPFEGIVVTPPLAHPIRKTTKAEFWEGEEPKTEESTSPETTVTAVIPTEPFNEGVVEIPTPVLTVETFGTLNDSMILHQPIQKNQTINEFAFTVMREGPVLNDEILVSTDHPELFSIRPRKIIPGQMVNLVVEDSEALNEMPEFELKISAELFGEKIVKTVLVSVEMKENQEHEENPVVAPSATTMEMPISAESFEVTTSDEPSPEFTTQLDASSQTDIVKTTDAGNDESRQSEDSETSVEVTTRIMELNDTEMTSESTPSIAPETSTLVPHEEAVEIVVPKNEEAPAKEIEIEDADLTTVVPEISSTVTSEVPLPIQFASHSSEEKDKSLEISVEATEIIDTTTKGSENISHTTTMATTTTTMTTTSTSTTTIPRLTTSRTVASKESVRLKHSKKGLKTPGNMKLFEFSIPEMAKDGDVVGEIRHTEGYFMGGSSPFKLEKNRIVVSCPTGNCLDRETNEQYRFMLVPTSNRLSDVPIQVIVNVEDVNDNAPSLELSDKTMRISNGQLLMPFAMEVIDADSGFDENLIAISGSASQFLSLAKVEEQLYEIKVSSFPPRGKFELVVTVSDRTGKYAEQRASVDVHVQNTQSKAHFRRPRYERTVNADKMNKGNPIVEPELEGVPVDSVRFMALKGNPGWLSVDDYNGHITIGEVPRSGVVTGRYKVSIVAVDRDSNAVVTECELILNVLGGKDPKPIFKENVITANVNRDHLSDDILVPIPISRLSDISVVADSAQAIDEDGLLTAFNQDTLSIEDNNLRVKKEVVKRLRIIQAKVMAEKEIATVILYLSSDPAEIEEKRKEAGRPVFAVPWTKSNQDIDISLREESPIGSIVFALPANNPLTGESVPVRIQGDEKEKFNFDQNTGELRVASRFDFEKLSEEQRKFDLFLEAGEEGFTSKAILTVRITDVDDNPPMFDRQNFSGKVSIPEDSPAGMEVVSFPVEDKDAVERINVRYSLLGDGYENFAVAEKEGLAVLYVAPDAHIDRENKSTYNLEMIASDASNNTDSVLVTVLLNDVNDNAPVFEHDEYVIQAVENWPAGVSLGHVIAHDSDEGDNGQIVYRLKENSSYFSIDSSTGELKVVRDLFGLASDEAYPLTVIAEDLGSTSLSSSVSVRVIVSSPHYSSEGEKGEVRFISPTTDYVLQVKENTPLDKPIFTVQAQIVGMNEDDKMHLKYTAKPATPEDVGFFDVDENSGEIFAKKPLDYEQKKAVTVGLSLMTN